ncbi:MAG: sulfurtransferase [Betaproteobacteria bacterium]|nr:sulfurtransferase [Betaproteobacteria bacterium]
MRQLEAPELRAWLTRREEPVTLLDVREPWEFALCRMEGSVHIPLGQLPARHPELDPARTTVVICHHGMRSLQAGAFLERQGFSDVVNLRGGIDGWARGVDTDMAVY